MCLGHHFSHIKLKFQSNCVAFASNRWTVFSQKPFLEDSSTRAFPRLALSIPRFASFDPKNLAPFQLKNLALCDLEARMANLDSAMDSEIDSLRRRYDLVTAAIYPLQMRWIRFMGMIGYGGVSFSYGCIDSVMDSEIDSLRTRHDFGYGEYF